MNDIVEYMKDKSFSDETIIKVEKYVLKHSDTIDYYKSIVNLYELLSFANFNSEQIQMFISNSLQSLDLSLNEIIKLAWVYKETGMIDNILTPYGIKDNLINYKRLYMRYLLVIYTKKPIKKKLGYRFYFLSSSVVYGTKYSFPTFFSSDEELEEYLNKNLKINGESCTLDDYITYNSKKFYIRYLNYKNEQRKKTNDKSIRK